MEIKCPNCDCIMNKGAEFCPNCGSSMKSKKKVVFKDEETEKMINTLKNISLTFIIIGWIVGGLILFGSLIATMDGNTGTLPYFISGASVIVSAYIFGTLFKAAAIIIKNLYNLNRK